VCECGEPIPASRRLHCSKKCGDRACERRTRTGHRWQNDHAYRENNKAKNKEKYHREMYGPGGAAGVTHAKDRFAKARALGYRSGLEVKIARELEEAGVKAGYETVTIRYVIPERASRYTVDFVLPNGILAETKGRFLTEDRKKHRLLREQYPELDVRLVFSNPDALIGKRSKTTYAKWCDMIGIPYAAKSIPQEWLDEPPNKASLAIIKRLTKEKA